MKILTGLVFASTLCLSPFSQAAAGPVDVSLVQLIANPKDYDGKIVRAIGFVKLEFEGNAVYLHQDDYKHAIPKNGLWLSITDDIRRKRSEFDGKYVLLEGTFNAKMTGHMGLWSGSIQQISRIEAWPPELD